MAACRWCTAQARPDRKVQLQCSKRHALFWLKWLVAWGIRRPCPLGSRCTSDLRPLHHEVPKGAGKRLKPQNRPADLTSIAPLEILVSTDFQHVNRRSVVQRPRCCTKCGRPLFSSPLSNGLYGATAIAPHSGEIVRTTSATRLLLRVDPIIVVTVASADVRNRSASSSLFNSLSNVAAQHAIQSFACSPPIAKARRRDAPPFGTSCIRHSHRDDRLSGAQTSWPAGSPPTAVTASGRTRPCR